jgi:hypothetical protein
MLLIASLIVNNGKEYDCACMQHTITITVSTSAFTQDEALDSGNTGYHIYVDILWR